MERVFLHVGNARSASVSFPLLSTFTCDGFYLSCRRQTVRGMISTWMFELKINASSSQCVFLHMPIKCKIVIIVNIIGWCFLIVAAGLKKLHTIPYNSGQTGFPEALPYFHNV